MSSNPFCFKFYLVRNRYIIWNGRMLSNLKFYISVSLLNELREFNITSLFLIKSRYILHLILILYLSRACNCERTFTILLRCCFSFHTLYILIVTEFFENFINFWICLCFNIIWKFCYFCYPMLFGNISKNITFVFFNP